MKKYIFYIVIIYFISIYVFLLNRNDFYFLGHWITIISQKKLVVMIVFSLFLSAIYLLCSKVVNKKYILILLILNVGIPIMSYDDFYSKRGGVDYQKMDFKIVALNNPYLDKVSQIRLIKKTGSFLNCVGRS